MCSCKSYLNAICNRLSLKNKNFACTGTDVGTRCALSISLVSLVVLRFVVPHFTCDELFFKMLLLDSA